MPIRCPLGTLANPSAEYRRYRGGITRISRISHEGDNFRSPSDNRDLRQNPLDRSRRQGLFWDFGTPSAPISMVKIGRMEGRFRESFQVRGFEIT